VNWAIVADSASTVAGLAEVLAQATTGPAGAAAKPSGILEFFSGLPGLMMVLLVFLWVFIFSSKRKEDRKKKDLLGNLKRGDRVQTIGGIIGKVVETEDKKVLLKVDESSNTKIWFSRSAIFQVLGEEKAVEMPTK
jgi:preprotein translocase subunit YajC